MRTNLGQAEDRKRTYEGPHRQKVELYQQFYQGIHIAVLVCELPLSCCVAGTSNLIHNVCVRKIQFIRIELHCKAMTNHIIGSCHLFHHIYLS